MATLLFTLATLFFTIAQGLHNTPNCNAPEQGSTLQLISVNSPCSPFRPKTPLSWADTVLQMQSSDKARLQYLSSLLVAAGRRSIVPIASGRAVTQNPTYIVRAKIGTPAQTLLMAVDTSNDAAWIPCTGCVGCSGATTYDSSKSATFKPVSCGAEQCNQWSVLQKLGWIIFTKREQKCDKFASGSCYFGDHFNYSRMDHLINTSHIGMKFNPKVPNPSCGGATCGFNLTYGGSTIAATLVQDNITLATDSVSGYTFGCIQKATGASVPAQGLLGLGRGPLSLLSQSCSLYQSTFSYCLPSYKSPNFTGSLRLGPNSHPKKIRTTELLKNPRRSSFYYVNLMGIRVGRRVVNIPPSAFAFDPTTGAGTVFDSGIF